MFIIKNRKLLKIVSKVSILVVFMTLIQSVQLNAAEKYEETNCTLYAMSDEEGAISINANNLCINGDLYTNGSTSISGLSNVNGKIEKYINHSIFLENELLESDLFSDKLCNSGDLECNKDVINYNDVVMVSKYGDISIESMNVSMSGVIYSPFGKVEIIADNINLNGVLIVANEIILNGNNVNINHATKYNYILQKAISIIDIPLEDWGLLKDINCNKVPDILEDNTKWKVFLDSDIDGIPDIIEKNYGFDYLMNDSDKDGLDDYSEMFVTYTDVLLYDSDENGISDAEEDFDNDLVSNVDELANGTDPYFCDDADRQIEKHVYDDSIDNNDSFSDCLEDSDGEYNIALLSIDDDNIYTRAVTLHDFEYETDNIEDDIENYFSDYDVISSKKITDKSSSFIKGWNNMAATGRHYTICIINCHGNPTGMYNGINSSSMSELKMADCDVVLLLGCNCGHYDYLWSNMAYHLSKKTTGIVVASDGTVFPDITNIFGLTQKFNSKADDTFDDYCDDDRSNYGWVIYKYNHTKKLCSWYTTNLKTITIKTLFNYLDKTGFIDV